MKKTAIQAMALAVALAALPATGRAQNGEEDIRQTVARLAYVSGDVSFSRGDAPDDWQPANLNVPMTLGDRVWTGEGRAELQVHGGNLIRVATGTDLTAMNLTDDMKQFSISVGVGFFRVQRLGENEIFEVDTPNTAITFERPGDYRVDVDQDGNTRIQVRKGRAIAAAGGGQVPLSAGDGMVIDGIQAPRYDIVGLPQPDSWDRWVQERNVRLEHVRSYQYVTSDIAGVADLDQYGRWQQIPSYGWVWTPTSYAPGWTPYSVGRWIWQDPWGWTWVSSEAWGWAPYHYGRWVVASSRWYWVPVASSVRVVAYSPALVAFSGGGPGWSASAGIVAGGYIGWFPLAPRDPLIPWWGPRPVNVQVTNITYVNRTYVTVVNQTTFVGGRAVAQNTIHDRSIVHEIERAPILRGPIPVVPTRESIHVTTGNVSAPRPPAVVSRQVVTHVAPPPAPPHFDTKVAVIRENRGAPVQAAQAARISVQEPTRPVERSRPVASETGAITLAPKNADSRAARPEPIAPARGRPATAQEQQPAAQAPAAQPLPRDGRPATAQEQQPAAPVPAAQPPPRSGKPATAQEQQPAAPVPAAQPPPRSGKPAPAQEQQPAAQVPAAQPPRHSARPTAAPVQQPAAQAPRAQPPAERAERPAEQEKPAAHPDRPTPRPVVAAPHPTPNRREAPQEGAPSQRPPAPAAPVERGRPEPVEHAAPPTARPKQSAQPEQRKPRPTQPPDKDGDKKPD